MDIKTFQKACALGTSVATRWADPVSAAMALYDISTLAQVAAFLAQVGHESVSFAFTKELWGPTPAQSAYEGRADLGNIHPGDGRLFCGRGLIQITGRYNYQQVSNGLGIDFVTSPELLEQPSAAAQSAAWYWNMHSLNQFCTGNADDFVTLTRHINGGTNGLADRQQRWATAKLALGA